MSLRVIFLVLLIQVLQTSANDCVTYLIKGTTTSFTCSASGSYPASTSLTPLVLNPSKELTVAISIKPTGICGLTSDFNFLTVSATTSAGIKRLMKMTYVFATGSITFNSEDSSTTQTALTKSVTFVGTTMNLFLSVNLASNTFAAGVLADDGTQEATIATMNYGSDWVFDSTSLVSVCSDYDGSNAIACTVDNIKVAYSFYSSSTIVNTGNSANLIGDYKLNDGTGSTTLANSQTATGSLGSATFSTPPPTWTSDAGIQFTSSSQYIQIPAFIPSSADQLISASVGFTFYIKIDSLPTADTNVFQYWNFNLAASSFALKITSSMKLKSLIDEGLGPSVEGATVLNFGEWNQVYVSYLCTTGSFGAVLVQINGGSVDSFPHYAGAIPSTVFSLSDYLVVGQGFIGQIRRFQVYSPATLELNSQSCNPTTCSATLGFSDPQTCLEAICTNGYYTSFGTCESCLTGCATCNDATTCKTCSLYYYLSGTSCLQCPSHCTSCTDSQTCLTCDPGYGLYNNLCTICPSGTTLTKDQICEEFSETLKNTLSTSQTLGSVVTQVVNAISKGSSVSLSATVAGKVFSQIKYFDISYSGELQVALQTWVSSFVSLSLTPDIPVSTVDKIPERHVPEIFEKYDVSSSFLINFWESLGIIIFGTVAWVTFKGLELLFSSKKKLKLAFLSQKARIMAQNFLISSLYGCYGDIVLFSLIEYRSFEFGWNLSLLSFIISLILLLVMFASFWYQINLLLNYQKLKKRDEASPGDSPKQLERFTKANEGNQTLWKDFKDDSLTPQLYLFFLSARDIIISLLLATMFDYPQVQTFIALILSLLMIAYLLMKRPLESTFDLIQIIFFEIIGAAVGICILINATLGSDKSEAAGSRKSLGKTIIVFNLAFNLVTALLMLTMVIGLIKEAWAFYKARKDQRRKVLKLDDKFPRPSSDDSDSPQKSSMLFDLSQMTNQRFVFNMDSEADTLQRSRLDLEMPPAPQFRPSYQQTRVHRNLARITQFDIMRPPPQISRGPVEQEPRRFANRKPFRQNNSVMVEPYFNPAMNQRHHHQQQQPMEMGNNILNRENSMRRRRINRNPRETQLSLRNQGGQNNF